MKYYHALHITGLLMALVLTPMVFLVNPSIWLVVGSILVFYFFHVVGHIVGNHKYWTHNSFKASTFSELIMLSAVTLGFIGHPLFWGNGHIAHHDVKKADTPKDPVYLARKSNSLWKAIYINHFSKFAHGAVDRRFTVRLLRSPTASKFMGMELAVIFGVIAALYFLPLAWVVYLWAIPVTACMFIAAWAQIRLHNGNPAENDNPIDQSINTKNPWYRIVFCGEELQNNHHSHPESSTFATRHGDVDVSDIVVNLLRKDTGSV